MEYVDKIFLTTMWHNNVCIYVHGLLGVLWVATGIRGILIFSIFWMASDCLESLSLFVYFGAKYTQRAGPVWIHESRSREWQGPRTLVNQEKDMGHSSTGFRAGQSSPRLGAEKGVKQPECSMESELPRWVVKT